MDRTAIVISVMGLVIHTAIAGAAACLTFSQRASNTWATMGLGMHIVLGKAGLGDMTNKPEEAGAAVAQALVHHKARQ